MNGYQTIKPLNRCKKITIGSEVIFKEYCMYKKIDQIGNLEV